jgi:hypothetical protein
MNPRPFRIAALALVALAGACSSDSSVAPTKPADLSRVLSEASHPALSSIGSSVAGAPIPSASAPLPSSCSYDPGTKSFVCPNVTVSGLTFTRKFKLLDQSNAELTQWDASKVAAVRVITTAAGTVTTTGRSLTIDQAQDLTVSGLLSGVHTLDGTSTTQLTSTSTAFPTPVKSTITMTFTKLVLPTEATAWPVSGTVSVDATNPAPAGTVHMQLTFNGTSKVAVTIGSGASARTCTIDLSQQMPSCV